MSQQPVWLDEQTVATLVTLDDVIVSLESTLLALGKGEAFNIPKALGTFHDSSSMHSLGSALPDEGVCGYKSWINTPQGAKALYTLFDAKQGVLLAIFEANALGQLRTAAMTGLGTKWMASAGASTMALCGSGRQALTQIAAVNAVRPLSRLHIWSPNKERRAAFADKVRSRFSFEVTVADSLEAVSADADIVTLVTRARDPFFSADLLRSGAHLNAVGAILPAWSEFLPNVFDRASLIVVDDVEGAKRNSREFIEKFGEDEVEWKRITPLAELIAAGKLPAPSSASGDVTLFKALGMGLSDLAVAKVAHQRAVAQGLGVPLPVSSKPATLRWKT